MKARICLWTLSGHSGLVNSIVYSSRGDLVISASDDKSVRVWDVTSGQCRAVIQDFQAGIYNIAWIKDSDLNYLAVGCKDGEVGMWQVLTNVDRCDISLRWKTSNGELDMKDATIQDVQGLSQLNRKLLKQRGAIGDPAHRLREASKNVATMVSVVSKLKPLSERAVESSSLPSNAVVKELEQKFQHSLLQVKDTLIQDVMTVFEKNVLK